MANLRKIYCDKCGRELKFSHTRREDIGYRPSDGSHIGYRTHHYYKCSKVWSVTFTKHSLGRYREDWIEDGIVYIPSLFWS